MTMEPKRFGKYVVLVKVGQGAMGEVYKAHDPALNRFVAIKTIAARLVEDRDLRARFRREAQSAAQLNHPNVITVYDFGEEQGEIYMAMELLQGSDLRDLIQSKEPLGLEHKLRLMEQICDGLGYAHATGLVHRDLKPGNIHIQPNGHVKVLDFGLARLASSSSDITKTGMVVGTPNYMSPEQVQGQRVDTRSDVFSLGAVFYELLTYKKPFQANSVHATMFKVVQGEREPLASLAPNLPAPLIRVVDKALAKDPRERYQNAGELREALHALRSALGGEPGSEEATAAASVLETIASPPPTGARQPPPGRRAPPPPAEVSVSRRTVRAGQLARWRGRSVGLYLGGGIGVALLAGMASFFFRSPSSNEDPAMGLQEEAAALVEALAESQLELAKRSLAAKDYQEAITQVERVLDSHPQHAEAMRIRDEARATLASADAAVEEARAALDAGETEKAAQAIATAFELHPSHPVGAELSDRLNQHFRTRAEDARADMRRSQRTAETAGAASAKSFVRAGAIARQAAAELGREAFAAATQRFLEARDLFDQTYRVAQARQRARRAEEAARAATQAGQEQAPQNAAELEAEPPPAPEGGVASRESGQGAATTPAPPVGEAPTSATPSPPRQPPGVNEKTAIRKAIASYERAIETKDLALFKAVKPNLSRDEEKRVQAGFDAVRSQQVEIDILSIEVEGQRATVRLARRDTIDINGSQQETQVEQAMSLTKTVGGWVIVAIHR
ncbi:MAG: protein kinase [Acidobacteriota bacterium]